MRVVLWNCKGGLQRKDKVDYLLGFRPDIAVIPEIRETHVQALGPQDFVWVTNHPAGRSPKGLGVLCFGDYRIQMLPRDEEMEIYLPLKVQNGSLSFNLLAVWNFYHLCKQGRFHGVKGEAGVELSALRHYQPFLADPSLLIGDLNMGPTLSLFNFSRLTAALGEIGLKDLSRTKSCGCPDGSPWKTFRMMRKGNIFHHHLDHVFGSVFFEKRLGSFEVDEKAMDMFSDHSTVALEFQM